MESAESIKELLEKAKGKDEWQDSSAYIPDRVDYTDAIIKMEGSGEQIKDSPSVIFNPFIGIKHLPKGSIQFNKDNKNNLLGKGAFGQVYKGEWNRLLVALKEIDIKIAQQRLGLSEEEIKEALQWEVSRLAAVSHPNLVQFYGLYIEEAKDKSQKPYLVLEYCEGGDLRSALNKAKPDWSKRWQWALEISQGLAYLHHQGMLHRDLKAENILIDGNGRAKLADLGVAQVDALLQKEEARVVFKGLQDWRFAAPEALISLNKGEYISTKETDMYALGIVFWQLISGKEPRRYEDSRELLILMQKGERESIPKDCPPEFKELILGCWAFEPSKRLSIGQVLEYLNKLLPSVHPEPFWMSLCQKIDVLIHPKSADMLSYIPSLVTEHQVYEDLDVYWQRLETKSKNENKLEGTVGLGNPPLKLKQIFTEFLVNPQPSTLLLLGESGLGKTLSTYQLAYALMKEWWQYLTNPSKGVMPYFPIFIRPALSRWSYSELGNGFEKALKSYAKALPVSVLKEGRFLIIVDGYDECEANEKPSNLAEVLGIKDLSNIKLIVTCRPNTVESKDLSQRFALKGNLIVRYFLPFSIVQLLDYLNQGIQWDKDTYEHYQEKFQQSHSLRAGLRNPFVASLFIQSWETVKQKDFNQLNRWQIYQSFVEHWINTQHSLLSPTIKKALTVSYKNKRMLESLVESFNSFAAEIAFNAFNKATIFFDKAIQNKDISLSNTAKLWLELRSEILKDSQVRFKLRQKELNKEGVRRALLDEEDYTAIMQWRLQQFEAASPLKNKGLFCEFSHKSFFEYFVARRIIELKEKDCTAIVEEVLDLLNHRPIQAEPEVMVFLAEGWQEDKMRNLIGSFFEILEYSKKEEFSAPQTSANAATILNVGRVAFSDKDLSGIRIPGANLSYGLFDNTNFQNADLRNVQLQGAWLREANLRGSLLRGIEFGESPFILLDDKIYCSSLSPDGGLLALGFMYQSHIVLYDITTKKIKHTLKSQHEHTLLASKDVVLSIAFDTKGYKLISGSSDTFAKLWDITTHDLLMTFKGHTKGIASVCFYKDDTQVITGSYDKSIRLWDIKTGETLTILNGHEDMVCTLAISPNNCYLASGSIDCTVRLWDILTGKILKIFTGHKDGIFSISFHPNEQQLVSGSKDNTIKLWDIATGKLLKEFVGHTGWVTSVIISPTRQQLISASFDSTIRLWNIVSGELLREFEGHTGYVSNIIFYHDGEKLISTSGDKTVRIWNMLANMSLNQSEGHTSSVNSVIFDPTNSHFVSGSDDGTIKLWSKENNAPLRTFKGHSDAISSVIYNYQQLVSVSEKDKSIRFWDIATGKLLKTLEEKTLSMKCATLHPMLTQIVCEGEDNSIVCWDINNRKILRTFKDHTGYIKSILFDQTGSQIISTSHDKTIRIWDNVNDRRVREFNADGKLVRSVAFDNTGCRIASGGDDQILKLWDSETGTLLKSFEGHTSWISSVAFHPKEAQLASASKDSTIRIWDINNSTLLKRLEGHNGYVMSITFNSTGSQIASGGEDKILRLWDSKSGKLLRMFEGQDRIQSVVFHPTKEQLASGGGNIVQYWDIVNGSLIRTFEAPTSLVMSIAFHPAGSHIAAGSWDSMVYIWDIANGNSKKISQDGFRVKSIAFHPMGTQLAVGCERVIKFWDIESGELIKVFEGHADLVNCLAFHPSTNRLVSSGSRDKTIRIWEDNSKRIKPIKLADPITCIALQPHGQKLASGNEGGDVLLWDSRSSMLLKVFHNHIGAITGLAFHPAKEQLVSGGIDGRLIFWDTATHQCLLNTYIQMTVLSIDWKCIEDKTYLVTGSANKSVCYWYFKKEKDSFYLSLLWSSHQKALMVSNINFEDAKELSFNNKILLEQRKNISKNLQSKEQQEELPAKKMEEKLSALTSELVSLTSNNSSQSVQSNVSSLIFSSDKKEANQEVGYSSNVYNNATILPPNSPIKQVKF